MRKFLLALLALMALALAGCTSDGTDDPISQPDAGMAGADAGELGEAGYMESCDPGEDQCEEGLQCFNFNAKGPHCTHGCSMDNDCAEPSSGCNNMGVCKAP